MARAVRQIALSAAILIVFCVVCRLVLFRDYTALLQLPYQADAAAQRAGYSVVVENPDVVSRKEVEYRDGRMRIPVRAEHAGATDLIVYDGQGEPVTRVALYVSRFNTVYDASTGGFTGDNAVLIALSVFWLLVSCIMLWNFLQVRGAGFYTYMTIYFAGFSMFALVTGILNLEITIRHLIDPFTYNMATAYTVINSASLQFMMLTLPLIVVFSLSMAVSNIVLLRHEKPRPQNFLGLLVSALMLAGEAVGFILFTQDFSGSEWQYRAHSALTNVYATVFVYFECMLAGSIICGVKAARHQPAQDKDFIIILGCWFRRDGSLPPLLRGRVDRAVEFWRAQKSGTGKEAYLIPSGGQGVNESMTEAEAMRRYLVSRDIPEELILKEDQSRNTYQNMANSRAIIEREKAKDAKTVFATNNYHVFRSGVWARLAGLEAEGIGGSTKWWFWPNAFMRECVGLLQNRWKQELVFLAVLLLFFASLSVMLG